jgi:periplasmic copper chaperone A
MHTFSMLAYAAVLIAATSPAFAQETKAPIAVGEPYARETPAGAQTGAVYMMIENKTNTPDRLTAASSDVASRVQVHEMSMTNGVMKMRELADGLAIPAGGSVTLKPGGYHIMLVGLKKPLKAGETFPLTLTFEKAGNISVTVPVQAMGAMPKDQGSMGHMEMK